jgi:DNA helicase-2/ATP-dependent DNA helicase PcrA
MIDVSFNTKDVTVYIASAGAGKTTVLMDELSTMLKTYRPDEIAFTTFTRKGVETGKERALNINAHLSVDDLPYFQTLHRMAFHEAKLKKKNIIEPADLVRFNKMFGYNVQFHGAFNNQTDDDKMLSRYDAIRSNATQGVFVHQSYDEERYYYLTKNYEKFKQENNLVDFYDCLLRYRESGKPLPVAAFLLDEAQDLTGLQWEVVMLAAQNAQVVRIAGDPAQTLFSYSGAYSETLINVAKKYKTVELYKTYRLPKKVCKVADAVIDLMQEKIPRTHKPIKNVEGVVQDITDREWLARLVKADFEKHSEKQHRWFFLFRTNFNIADMASILEKHVIPYHTSKGFVISERDLSKIRRYENYKMSGFGTEEAKAKFMEDYGIKDLNDHFVESNLIPSDRRYVYADYIDRYGLTELENMVRRPAFLLLSTVYKVKGGEADNVAVFLDATKQVACNMVVDLDGEFRVFYVACTRAREKLYMVQPITKFNIASLWESTVDRME